MNEMQLYRLLQHHCGETNKIVIALYKGEITAADAEKKAKEILENTLSEINK